MQGQAGTPSGDRRLYMVYTAALVTGTGTPGPPLATPLGYYRGFSASKYAWLNIGEGEGTLQ